jgi:hypothetical protein
MLILLFHKKAKSLLKKRLGEIFNFIKKRSTLLGCFFVPVLVEELFLKLRGILFQ